MGTRYHARILKEVEDDHSVYALIDPLDAQGARVMSIQEVGTFLRNECRGQSADRNFFYIV